MRIYFIYFFLASFVVTIITLYNRMVSLRKRAQGAWADVDVQLKRRHDLTPSLVMCVEGYMSHERKTLLEVTTARSRIQEQGTLAERSVTETQLGQNLKSLILLAENYPDLKANTTFLSLQEKLTETENMLQKARRYYNAVIRDYNTLIGQFPHLIIAKAFNFLPLDFFQLENRDEAEVSKVSLD